VAGSKPVEVITRLVDNAGNTTSEGKLFAPPLEEGFKNFGLFDVAN
jgi:hypothetical protein